jgi:hypothetical protein
VGQVERIDGGGQGAGGMVMMIWRESREIETKNKTTTKTTKMGWWLSSG